MRIAHFVIFFFLTQGIFSQNAMLLNAEEVRARGIYDIRDLTTVVPGIFVSSLGSAHSTAVCMRGVGSCGNSPAVSLYVDDVPWLNNSSFNSKISEIEQIEILRGPQSTLYGRNAMGGLICVTTKNPIDYQGTVIERSMANHYAHYTNVSHYQRFSEKLGLSAGVAYRSGGQFFNHSISGLKVDADRSLRAHTRLLYRPDEASKIDFFANYELCSQDAFPFYLESVSDNDNFKDLLTQDIGRITSNDDNTYLRHLLNIGLKTEYNWPNVILGNVLGFQLLNDELKMDGDFTHLSIFIGNGAREPVFPISGCFSNFCRGQIRSVFLTPQPIVPHYTIKVSFATFLMQWGWMLPWDFGWNMIMRVFPVIATTGGS